MGDKQEPGLPLLLLEEAFEVECGNHCLTGTGGGDHQIAPAIMGVAFPLQCLKDALLKRVRPKIKKDCRTVRCGLRARSMAVAEEGRIVRIKRQKLTAVPVGLKLNDKLFEDMTHVLGRYLEIPFQAAGNGGM